MLVQAHTQAQQDALLSLRPPRSRCLLRLSGCPNTLHSCTLTSLRSIAIYVWCTRECWEFGLHMNTWFLEVCMKCTWESDLNHAKSIYVSTARISTCNMLGLHELQLSYITRYHALLELFFKEPESDVHSVWCNRSYEERRAQYIQEYLHCTCSCRWTSFFHEVVLPVSRDEYATEPSLRWWSDSRAGKQILASIWI